MILIKTAKNIYKTHIGCSSLRAKYSPVPGLTPDIQAVVQAPYRMVFRNAAKTVFLVSLAFSGPVFILSWLTTNNDKSAEYYAVHGNTEKQPYNAEYKKHRRASEPVGISGIGTRSCSVWRWS